MSTRYASDVLPLVVRTQLSPFYRPASHAGSWYTANGTLRDNPLCFLADHLATALAKQLQTQLEKNLDAVKPIEELDYHPPMDRCKALIGP